MLILFLAFYFFSCNIDMNLFSNYWFKNDNFDFNVYPVLKKTDEEFKILLLADTQLEFHFESFTAISQTFELIENEILKHKPDLIILLGDNISGGGFVNSSAAQRLIMFLDSFKIPYALVMGNHDGYGYFWTEDDNSKEVIANIYKNGLYSLFQRGPANLGAGNYGINILNDEGLLIYSLILMDNSRGYFTKMQVDWYEWFIAGINNLKYDQYYNLNDKPIPSMSFFHIPLPETSSLYDELKVTNPPLAAEYFREEVGGRGAKNFGMFEKMKQMQSTTHLFFSHDHLNILNYEYQDIRFIYGIKTGYCYYFSPDRIGTTLITISDCVLPNEIKVDISYSFY